MIAVYCRVIIIMLAAIGRNVHAAMINLLAANAIRIQSHHLLQKSPKHKPIKLKAEESGTK